MDNLMITSVVEDADTCDEYGMGMLVFVDFDNEAGISFMLDSKASDPLFNAAARGKAGKPQTDGKHVFWQNGAELTIGEMMAMVMGASEPVEC